MNQKPQHSETVNMEEANTPVLQTNSRNVKDKYLRSIHFYCFNDLTGKYDLPVLELEQF